MRLSQILTFTVALLIAAVAVQPVDAQKRRTATAKKKATTTAPAVIKGAKKNYDDIITTQLFTYKRGKSSIKVEWPADGFSYDLLQATRKWVIENVAADISGDYDSEATLEKAMRKALKLDAGETYNADITVTYVSNACVTFSLDGYFYAGGAHGMPAIASASFKVANDGTDKLLTYKMLPPFSKLAPYIYQGLAKDTEMSLSELKEMLNDPNSMNYPEYSDPYISAEGLVIQYAPYEILPYMCGAPRAVLPLSQIKSLLSPQVLAYF